MSNERDKKKHKKRILILLAAVLVLVVIDLMLLVNRPDLFRAAPSNPRDIRHALLEKRGQQPSITYEVFKPVIDPYNNVVNFFRPSSLRANYYPEGIAKSIGCGLLPANPSRIPFKWLMNLGRGCY